ncbi:MAG: PHP domain-containing protein [Limnothrix sp.]
MNSTVSTPNTAQDVAALAEVWRSITATSCPLQYNFHMHSVFSDGQLAPEAIVDQAIAIGLKGFAITDHHTVKGYHAAQAYLQQKAAAGAEALPHFWTGIEINGRLLETGVHILGYGFDPTHAAIQRYTKREIQYGEHAMAAVVVEAIHQAGGAAVLAHPARYRRPAADLIPAAADIGIDGVEAYYAYDNPEPWIPSPKRTPQIKVMGEAHNLLLTCGTDTHGLNLKQRL